MAAGSDYAGAAGGGGGGPEVDPVAEAAIADTALWGRAAGAGVGPPGRLTPAQSKTVLGVKAPTQQVFAVNGVGIAYNPPAGCTLAIVETVGAGASGAGAQGTASNVETSSGGCSGGYTRKRIPNPAACLMNVGAGGAGVAAGTSPGNNGGDTTFDTGSVNGAPVVAKGGGFGVKLANGSALGITDMGSGGAVGSGGDVMYPGNSGGFGVRLSGTVGHSGHGAPSILGGNSPGRSNNGGSSAAGGPGGGSAGALAIGAVSQASLAGADGCIIVTEFYT